MQPGLSGLFGQFLQLVLLLCDRLLFERELLRDQLQPGPIPRCFNKYLQGLRRELSQLFGKWIEPMLILPRWAVPLRVKQMRALRPGLLEMLKLRILNLFCVLSRVSTIGKFVLQVMSLFPVQEQPERVRELRHHLSDLLGRRKDQLSDL